jgi:hypothetical protein
MQLFNINYRKLAGLLLPTFLRKPVMLSLLNVVARELQNNVYDRFMERRRKNLFNLHYNGQVCYLRAALNDYERFGVEKDENGVPVDGFEIEGVMPLGYWLFAYREENEGRVHDSMMIILARESATAEAESEVKPTWIYKERDIEAVLTGFKVLYPKDKIEYIDRTDCDKDKHLYDQMVELVNYFRIVSRKPDYIRKDQYYNLKNQQTNE